MADPLGQYGSVFDEPGEDFRTYRPPIPTLAGDSVRPPQPPAPAEARSYTPTFRDRVRAALSLIPGFNPQTAESVATVAPYTPAAPIFEGGRLLGEAAENRSNTGALLGLGSIALGAAPLPLPAPARRLGPLAQYGRREPPPLTGHNIGSLQIPRVPREVDPSLGLYSAADEAAHSYPRTAGTARDIQDWMASQGVTANEMAARGLTDLFRSPQQVITRQQLLGHLGENPIRLRSSRYQGAEPEIDLRRFGTNRDEHGNLIHDLEDTRTGRQFILTEDRDAGNVYVQNAEGGAFLPVPGRINRQTYDDGIAAIRSHLNESGVPPGAAGPARYGPDQWPDLSLNAAGNPTYREDVLYAPPDLRAQARSGRSPLAFTDSHYPNEPNPIGWIRSSRQEAFERGPTGEADVNRSVRGVLWDELQMPMAQRIRDEGARNEAQLARARSRIEDLTREYNAATGDASMFMVENRAVVEPMMSRLNATEQGDFVASLMAVNDQGRGSALGQRAHDLAGRVYRAERDLALARRELATAEHGIVGNPFVNDTNQALRTLMHYGLQNPALRDPSVQGIFLTPGVLQNERYDLARHAETLGWRPTAGERHQPPYGVLYGRSPGRAPGELSTWDWQKQIQSRDELDAYIGRDLAGRLLAAPERSGLGAAQRALDLRNATEVGGHGMRENYDRIYPETLDAILRRLDPAYPGRRLVNLNSQPHGYTGGSRAWYPEPVHYFPLTDRIRAQLARGLPYFAGAGAVATPALMGENEDPLQQYGGAP